jgi:membrane fusion protein, multidrug efflux system
MRVPGKFRPWLIAGILLILAAWIASGVLTRDMPPEQRGTEPVERKITVAVRLSKAEPVDRLLVLHGDLQPEQVVIVRAETSGQIEGWEVNRGAAVSAGDLLATIELGERRSRRQQVRARLQVAEHQLRATRQLVKEGYEPEIQLNSAMADLEAVQADLDAIEEEINRTRIRAPIPGRVDQRIAERGDFVATGGEVAQIVNNDPLRAMVRVPQHHIELVQVGQPARIRAMRHGEASGKITFVSILADPATRTFLVEVEVPNPDYRLPAGTSAEVEILTDKTPAHMISPAIIGLDDEGRVGVKSVDQGNRVRFHVIEVVRAERRGLWVSGLPETVKIITVGQGFVRVGEEVRVRFEDEKE